MRILYVISSAAAGGAEVYIRDLAVELKKLNHEVFILFLDRAKEVSRDADFEEYFLSILREYNIGYDFIGTSARFKPWIGVLSFHKSKNKFSPDVIHCHLYYGVIFSFFTRNIKVVYTHHNILVGAPRFIYKFLDLKVSNYVGICAACEELLNSLTKKKVIRIDNGVSKSRIKKKLAKCNPAQLDNENISLVCIGALSVQKNLQLLLSSLSICNQKNYILKIAGEGPEKSTLMNLAEKLGIKDKVVFLGNIQNVNELLHDSDVYVSSSAWEGLPIAQIEATLAGLPVIVTNVGGCAEIVNRVCNGIVVNKLDENIYAEALSSMLRNDRLRGAYSTNALSYSDSYEIKHSVIKHISLYSELLSEQTNI